MNSCEVCFKFHAYRMPWLQLEPVHSISCGAVRFGDLDRQILPQIHGRSRVIRAGAVRDLLSVLKAVNLVPVTPKGF